MPFLSNVFNAISSFVNKSVFGYRCFVYLYEQIKLAFIKAHKDKLDKSSVQNVIYKIIGSTNKFPPFAKDSATNKL